MEFSRIFGLFVIVYAFIRLLPKKGRFNVTASIPILVVLLFSTFSYQNEITNSVIKLFNSGSIFYAQMIMYSSLFFLVEMALSSKALKSEGAMEFSQFLDFLKILRDSIKLVSKNCKLMGLVTIVSLLVPSILFCLFTYVYKHLINRMAKSSSLLVEMAFLAPPLLVEMAFLLACSVIFQLSAIATISISADHNNKLSLKDLFSRMKKTWRRQLSNSFSGSRNPTLFELVNGAISKAISVTTIVNITPAVMLIAFQEPSAVWPLSNVVSVVEESSDGGEAVEKAERLVQGQRVHGFMLKLLFILALVYCLILGDAGPEIDLTCGLLLLHSLILGRIAWCILHTVLYFRCKKEIDALVIGKVS